MDLVSYGLALVLIAAAPGPVVTILLARTLAGEVRAAAAFAAGVVIGKLVIVVAIAGGLIPWLQESDGVLAAVKVLGIVYMLWIVLRLWQAADADPAGPGASPHYRLADMGAGLATSLSSPFSLLFYLAVLPVAGVGDHEASVEFVMFAVVTMAAPGAVFAAYILLACRLQSALARPRLGRRIRRTMAALLGCSTIWLVVT